MQYNRITYPAECDRTREPIIVIKVGTRLVAAVPHSCAIKLEHHAARECPVE